MMRLVGVLLVVVMLSGCAGGQDDPNRLVFWQFWDVATIQPMVDAFEASNPGVTVEVEQLTWKSGLEKIQAALASGTQPDVCELGSTWLPRFSYDGVLSDLTDVYNSDRDQFLMWESALWQGRVYGLPWVQGSRALFFNRELFRQAGLDPDRPPTTWAELTDAATRIDALADNINGFGQNLGESYVLYKKFMAFAWGNGGRILDDQGQVVFNQEPVVEALEYYVALGKHSLQEKQEVLDHEFKSGRLGMQVSGAWNIKNLAESAPNLDYGVALVPRPGVDKGTHASFAGAEMLVVFARSPRTELAVRFARFLQSYDQAKALSLAAGSVFPAAVEALSDSTFSRDARVRTFVEQSFTSRTAPAHPGWIEMEDVINQSLEEVMYGRRAPRWSLDDAATRLTKIVDRFDGRQ